jgi:predicted anti-sigma-YlaC factor YlaD
MSRDIELHPPEDALLAHVLERPSDEVAAHLSACESCRRFVGQVLSVRKNIEAFPEEEVPKRLGRRILEISARGGRRRQGLRLSVFRQTPLPAVIAMGVMAAALFLYFLFVYLF